MPRILTVYIEDMDCPVEQAQIETLFEGDLAYVPVHFDLVTRRVRFEANTPQTNDEALLEKLKKAGFEGVLVQEKDPVKTPESASKLHLGFALVLAVSCEALEWMGSVAPIWLYSLALMAIGLVGVKTLSKGVRNLLHLILNMNTLMAVAVFGALAIGEAPEAAMVMVLYEIGEAIEDQTMAHARASIQTLLQRAPQSVSILGPTGWISCEPQAIHAGTLYRVAPGEMLAADGTVIEGTSDIDTASITGETLPQTVQVGSFVRSGSIALEGALTIRAQCAAHDSTAARIARAIDEAQGKKAQVERIIDRFARYYTPGIFLLSLGYGVLCSLYLGSVSAEVIYRALVLLVIGCPCALVISTPVAIVSAIAAASRHGLFVRGGRAMEVAATLKTVAFDKTGTLTVGQPTLISLDVLAPNTRERVFTLAASLAAANQHPISRAIARAHSTEKLATSAVQALPGFGVEGRIQGALLRLTNRTWLAEHGKLSAPVDALFAKHEAAGLTTLALSDTLGVLGVFALSDTLRANAAQSVEALKRDGVDVWLLTGDTAKAAQNVAQAAGIDKVRFALLPEEKLALLDTLCSASPTAMVGDGINDAPALARAHLGIAMGRSGADIAIEAADVVLMNEDIASIGWLKALSQRMRRTILENIGFALGAKALFALGAFSGVTTMWMAVFADTGVCLLAVGWALRLLKTR